MPVSWQEWFAQRRKFFTAVVGIAAGIAVTEGWTSNHWVQLGISIATLLGLYAVPNKQPAKVEVPRAPSPSPSPGV
jgi:hypothetical protein